MIEFTGALSGEAKKYVIKEYRRSMFISVLIVWLLFGIPITVMGIFGSKVLLYLLFPLSLLFLIPIIIPGDDFFKSLLPTKVFIDFEEGTVVAVGDGFERFRMLADIVRIESYAWGYYIAFPIPHNDIAFTIQKDLITQGSIEQFEEKFKHLIVRLEAEC